MSKKPLIVAIACKKGGAGKTTLTLDLAYLTALDTGKRVLVIDGDESMNASLLINAKIGPDVPSLREVLNIEILAEDAIQTTPLGFDILPASEKLAKAAKEFGDALDIYKLQAAIESLDDAYDYIFLDTHPNSGVLSQMAIIAADYMIFPIKPEKGALAGLIQTYKDYDSFRKMKWTDAEIMGIVATACRDHLPLTQRYLTETLPHFCETYNCPMFDTHIAFSGYPDQAREVNLPVSAFKPAMRSNTVKNDIEFYCEFKNKLRERGFDFPLSNFEELYRACKANARRDNYGE